MGKEVHYVEVGHVHLGPDLKSRVNEGDDPCEHIPCYTCLTSLKSRRKRRIDEGLRRLLKSDVRN